MPGFTRHGARRHSFACALTAALLPALVSAQVSTNRVEGLRDNTPRHHAITGARLVLAPGKVVENGVLVLKDGRVVAAGAGVAVPAGARVWHLPGRVVYPGFIDLASSVGVPAGARVRTPQPPLTFETAFTPQAAAETRAPGPRALSSSNRAMRADFDVSIQLEIKAEELKAARDLGFTAVLASPLSGVWRGQSALLATADRADAKALVMMARVAQHAAIEPERGYSSAVQYPNSAMGAIALLRQTLHDARWQRAALEMKTGGERIEPNLSLEALRPVLEGKQPVVFAVDGEQDFLRAARLRDEFALKLIALGNGYEYRRAAQLKSLGMPVIVPVNFPPPPEVESPDAALDIQLEHLQHWEQAPSNPAYLAQDGIEFALTSHGLRDAAREFWPALRLAVQRGLPADAALAAITSVPARLIGAQAALGALEAGRVANVVVATGDLFRNDHAEVELTFIDGRPHAAPAQDRADVRGTWQIAGGGDWVIAGTRARPTLTLDGAACDVIVRGRQFSLAIPCARGTVDRTFILAESRDDELKGAAHKGDSSMAPWSATRKAAHVETERRPLLADVPPAARPVAYPAGTYGINGPPPAAHVLVRNATIWTSGSAGRLTEADLHVRAGKILAVGRNLAAPAGVEVIDARGKHVTPGIIDAHSHTAVQGGINESTSSVTAEVRVGDVLDATSISLYRQLAGGVTAANILHGSANTIGGQSQTIKFRWGGDAEGLKFANARPGIKFALGENVKQSNNTSADGTRYPQTRMGVEQVIRDAFAAAREYQRRWADWRAHPKAGPEPRRDLQLDALVELLEKKRVVHIHSYRADEILMFARVARELGIPVATFQHVLEGYKVADAIRDIGAGASSFSDWWGFKVEVADAIPYSGAIMHKVGVLTTFNSDSDELARRLNTEAAKAVRYGGVAETEALKFVTLNAAKQLGIDAWVGSLESGKDADFVIWSADPLSPLAIAEQTWIDGRRYYDLQSHRALQAQADVEKRRLVAKALPARVARLNAAAAAAAARVGGAAARPDASAAPQDALQDLLLWLRLQRELHAQAQYRGEYWDGGNWHECTEDAR